MWLVFGKFVFLRDEWMNTNVFWNVIRGIMLTNEYLLTFLRKSANLYQQTMQNIPENPKLQLLDYVE
jgi:hypothetical protein